MKIFIFILGKANKNRPNGVNQVIAGLCKYFVINGHSIRLIGLASNAKYEGEIIKRDDFEIEVYSRLSIIFFRAIARDIKWCDICHLHGVYNFVNILVGILAKKNDTPYVITPHNGFAPHLQKWKKKLFDFIFQKRHIEKASAIHILAQEESTEILSLFNPLKFILAPNGIDPDDFMASNFKNLNSDEIGTNQEKIVIGYLGRISEEKNIINLAKAIAQLKDSKSICLKLAGPSSTYLEKIMSHYSKDIQWVGPQYGKDKIEFIKSVDLFVHPSKTDVFSIAAMESLAIGTPLLITRDSKTSHFYKYGGFYMCEATTFGIKQAIIEVIDEREKWPDVTKKGRYLISSLFNWNTASLSLLKGYSSIILNSQNDGK